MPDRFPPEVLQVLQDAGWSEGRHTEVEATMAVDFVAGQVGRQGERTEPFAAAMTLLSEFGGIYVIQDGPGRDLARRPFALDPTEVAASTETLADLAKDLRTKLFPIGMEGDHDSILAVDESGAVYAIDHTGIWLLGDTVDSALVTLVMGTQPTRIDLSSASTARGS